MASVDILEQVIWGTENNWRLSFQWCRYNYDNDSTDTGYRFIWYRPDGRLQAARGQARIPSASIMLQLIQEATEAGWFITCENQRL